MNNDSLNLPSSVVESINNMSLLTDNPYRLEAVEFDDPIILGMTTNISGWKNYLGLKAEWLIEYSKDFPEIIPHELGHVIDSIGTYYQKSRTKAFKPVLDQYKEVLNGSVIKNTKYFGSETEIFARLLNYWCYDKGLIPLAPVISTPGDQLSRKFYYDNKELVSEYFNTEFSILDLNDISIKSNHQEINF